MKKDIKLVIDKYEMTMNEVYIQKGETEEKSYYDAFFRKIPFGMNYAVTAGLDSIINFIKSFRFEEDDIEYLKSLNTFSDRHIEYLRNFKFTGDIFAIPDGTVVFANEPLLTIRANKIEANLLESIILAYFNEQIKFTTASSKIMQAASNTPVMEFGARRADGPEAAIDASKCAFMAGACGTSNMAAGKLYSVPTLGTMAHSFVQGADSEYEAFLDYAKVWPDNAIFLVDTYNTINSGIPNAIRVAKEYLEPNGYELKGIRIDSGNLLELTKKARRMLDEAGLPNVKIVVSNGLDAETIQNLKDNDAPIDIIGLGDNIVAPKERVGVVYKLVGNEKDYEIIPKIKKSEDEFKTINPGYKKIYRLYDQITGTPLGDVIANYDEQIPKEYYIFTNQCGEEIKVVTNYIVKELQVPIFRNGELVYKEPTLNEKRTYCINQIANLPQNIKELKNTDTYLINITPKVKATKKALIEEINQIGKNELLRT